MTTSLNSVGAITLFVEDPQRSKSFYEDVFGALVICGVRATEGKGRDAAERPDGSAVGSAYRQLHRSGRPHLGDRPAAPLAGGSRSAH